MALKIEITPAMQAVVGVDSDPWKYEVTTTSVRGFARGVGYTDEVYFDESEAHAAGYRSLPCPPRSQSRWRRSRRSRNQKL